jgi:hypothetical protein
MYKKTNGNRKNFGIFVWWILHRNTQPQHTLCNTKNTSTMISPTRRLPAASIFYMNAIAICRTINLNLRNTAMQIFLRETNEFFILFTIILKAVDQHACEQKVCSFSEYLCFFYCCIKSMRTHPSYPSMCFCQCCLSPHHILA